jgi:hypothetical protein
MSPLRRIRVAGRYSMAFVWNEQQVLVFPYMVQRVNDLHRTCCIDIRIQLCSAKHRTTTQSPCIRDIGAFLVALFDGISHPRFVPLHLIHTVVVTPAVCGGDAVEVVVEEKSTHRILAPCGAAVYTDAAGVHPGARCSRRFYPGDTVGEACIFETLRTHVVESSGAPIGAHAVDKNDDEAPVGKLVRLIVCHIHLRHVTVLWSSVDLFDDGIFCAHIHLGGAKDEAADHRRAVSAWRCKTLRDRPKQPV